MNTFEFLVDHLPFGYFFNFDNYLFNKVKHINTQGIDERTDYFIVNNVKKRIEAKIHFLLKDHVAFSPYQSLFGSFEFNPRIHPNLLHEFWTFIENDLQTRGIHRCQITAPADCYAPLKAEMIQKVMDKSGFLISRNAINHHITVNENPIENRMHPMEIRRLKKCIDAGFTFQKEPDNVAEEIYDYIQQCRSEQNLEVSITKEKFFSYLNLFPQSYPFFAVRKGEKIKAATIAVMVHRFILYSFLPGSLRVNKTFSPTVMLNHGLYHYCLDHNITMLDLGISTEADGTDQDSLIAFKERMGGEKTFKHYYQKELV